MTTPTFTKPPTQRGYVYDDAEVKRRNRVGHRLHARKELELAVRAQTTGPAAAAHEIQRRVAIMERVAYWSLKPHTYIANLDPQGSMCDLCWASVDASQHLLHPIAVVKAG